MAVTVYLLHLQWLPVRKTNILKYFPEMQEKLNI